MYRSAARRETEYEVDFRLPHLPGDVAMLVAFGVLILGGYATLLLRLLLGP